VHLPTSFQRAARPVRFQTHTRRADANVVGHVPVQHLAARVEPLLEPSVSVCLPVHNAQSALPTQVERVLDMVSDLADRFELLIIDDGSTDETLEVARELSRRYPQIATVRHDRPQGFQAAVRTGLNCCEGDVLLVQAQDGRLHACRVAQVSTRDERTT
jgi:glycosyltransferase involved in cell wall biosynthesis